MTIQANQLFNGIYYLNPEINTQTLSDAIKAQLCKAEALAILATSTDVEAYKPDLINNYLWALSDLIREANQLFDICLSSQAKHN